MQGFAYFQAGFLVKYCQFFMFGVPGGGIHM